MKRDSRLEATGTRVSCPQCDAMILISGAAQNLTCRSCDTDLHYDGAGKCRTLLRDSGSGTRPAEKDPTRQR